MDMDVDDDSKPKGGEEKGKPIVVILVGAPGSGKSTFCRHVMDSSSRPWGRICQDIINNGKAGTKPQCVKSAASTLKEGKSVFIDRCNLDREERAEFVKLGGQQVDVHAVVLDLPAKLCISQSVKCTGREGNLQGGKAAGAVNRMLQKKELPKLSEGFARIMFCQNESDVPDAVKTYAALGPSHVLPNGCFGQKSPNTKIQVGIMKFLKKVEVPFEAFYPLPLGLLSLLILGFPVGSSLDSKAEAIQLLHSTGSIFLYENGFSFMIYVLRYEYGSAHGQKRGKEESPRNRVKKMLESERCGKTRPSIIEE